MKVVYLIQTHKNSSQINRLVQTIKQSSRESYVLISHNFKSSNLDQIFLQNLSGVEVISGKGGRGDFSLTEGYLNAINWLFSHQIEFDWLINITGQDYPTQSLVRFEEFLVETIYDGFLEHFDSFSNTKDNHWGSGRTGRDRYLYEYSWLSSTLSPWQRALGKIPQLAINNIQDFIRIDFSCGLSVGIRAPSSPFNGKFLCYGGSYFHILSRKCVQYLYDFSLQNSDLTSFYKKTLFPDESFIQTILVNSGLFNFCNDSKRYINWMNTQHGHPRILTIEDYSALVSDNIYFARKFDVNQDSKILDKLDLRIQQGS